jgi:hypothetical protein
VIEFRIDYLDFSAVVIKLDKAIELVEKVIKLNILNKKENDTMRKLPESTKLEGSSLVKLSSNQK